MSAVVVFLGIAAFAMLAATFLVRPEPEPDLEAERVHAVIQALREVTR